MTTLAAVDPTRPDVIPCFDPATGEPLGTVKVTSLDEVRKKIARAREAQRSWRRTTFDERRRVLGRMLDRILDEDERLVDLVTRSSGKTRENALMGEVWTLCEKLRWTIANGEKHLTPEPVSSGMLAHKKARLEFHPLGVVGAIVPWNYPLQNVLSPAITALFSGNAYVVKPSEWVAWSAEPFVELVRDALREGGHDPELVQLVQGDGKVGKALIESGVDVVVFIGSVENGRRVLAAAAEKLIPVVLELGGKDPFIVCDDANLEAAAHAAISGAFINCGQNCVASERILVHQDVANRFERRVGEIVGAMRQGPPKEGGQVDVGSMATPLQLEVVERLVKRAIAEGARVVVGGKRGEGKGAYFAPTVLADVTPDMEIMREETFGPVLLLTTVRSDDEAIAIANGTAFGLGSTVFSEDRARARRIADRLEAGMTGINDYGGMTYMAQDLTFGGIKNSGFGRMNGREGLRAMCNTKAVLDDRLPFTLPAKVYPVTPRDFGVTQGTLDLIYGRGIRRRLRGLARLAKSIVSG